MPMAIALHHGQMTCMHAALFLHMLNACKLKSKFSAHIDTSGGSQETFDYAILSCTEVITERMRRGLGQGSRQLRLLKAIVSLHCADRTSAGV